MTGLGKDLLHQKASPAALPDSTAMVDQPKCMEETRVELFQELDSWEKSSINAATMKWVVGGAGEGKTALLLTFADGKNVRSGRSLPQIGSPTAATSIGLSPHWLFSLCRLCHLP